MKNNEKILIIVLVVILALVIIVKVNQGGDEENLNNNAVPSAPSVGTETNEGTDEEPVEEYVQVLEDGTKLNTSEELSKTKMVDALEFTNIQLTNQNGQTVLLADVKNTGSTATDVTLVDVIILDEAGQELGTVAGIVSPLGAGETSQFNTTMTIDYANAYDFKIIKK